VFKWAPQWPNPLRSSKPAHADAGTSARPHHADAHGVRDGELAAGSLAAEVHRRGYAEH
jgi:hypothetical protein